MMLFPLRSPTPVTKRLTVRRRTERYVDRTPGYEPVNAERTIQELVEVYERGGKAVGSRVIDTEVVPEHVIISLGAFGDTGGWLSKWSDLIGAEKAVQAIGRKYLEQKHD